MRQARNHILPIIIAAGCSFCCPVPGHASTASATSYAAEIMKDVREDKVYLLENIRRKVTKPSEKAIIEALLCEDGPKAAKLYRKQLSECPDPKLDDISRSRLAAYDRAVGATPKPVLAASKSAGRNKTTPNTAAAPGRADSSVSRRDSIPSATIAAPGIPVVRKTDSTRQQPKAPAAKPAAAAKALPESKPSPAVTPAAVVTPATPAPAKPAGTAAPKPAAAGGNYTLQFGSFDSVTNADQLAAQLPPNAPAAVVEIGSIYKVRLKKGFATREEAVAFGKTLPIESFVVPVRP